MSLKSRDFDSLPDSRRPSSEFEEVNYPHWSSTEQPAAEELPLHYMQEDKARRRVKGPSGNGIAEPSFEPQHASHSSDDSKDVYSKIRQTGLPGPPKYYKVAAPPATVGEFIQQNLEHLPPIIYTLLSCWTRFHDIGKSRYVVWDEAHFGKFGSHYLKREFYFDVHPPLGKMLVGLVGALSGYTGQYDFKSGAEYPEDVPFVAMRVMLACFGVAMVPIGWYTAEAMGLSQRACHLVAIMVLCDVAWLTISRFILLDSMLLFFTCTTVLGLTKFHREQHDPFGFDWWMWLVFTGWSIGCVTSVKWIGLFVTSLVGLYTIEDLWDKFGDLRMPVKTYAKHWIARIGCLILLPILVYMFSFKIHFLILNHSGPGDSQMSSLFQAHLVGNDFSRNPLEIAYGSRLTFKNMGWGGGLLHSHVHTYPVGSGQQQITCYHYRDENNNWVILPRWDEPEFNPNGELRFLQHGDTVRIQHHSTSRNLHSHNVAAPVTKLNNEVSCYGNSTVGDHHDYWEVEVVDDLRRGSRSHVDRIHTLTTRLRLKHKVTGCYLRAANSVLPQWGWKQIEVSCDKNNNPKDEHTYWNVETHINDRLPAADVKHLKTSFLRDFWHLNVAMMTSNNALIPDPDKEDILASKPLDWPWAKLGLRMCGWGDDQIKYYLVGNPIIWWSGTASLFVAIATFVVYCLRWQRKYRDFERGEWEHMVYVGKVSLLGWCLHFLPFLVMGRVTYVHHYLPALYFSVLMAAHVVDHFVFTARRLSDQTKWFVFAFCVFAVVGTFWWFRGVSFGIEGPIKEHKGLLWRKSWNIYEQN